MAEQTPRRVECPICFKFVALRKDGMLWHHTGNKPEWPGSPFKAACPQRGLPPKGGSLTKRRRSSPDWADLREEARAAGWRVERTPKDLPFNTTVLWDASHPDTKPGRRNVCVSSNEGRIDVDVWGPRGQVLLHGPTASEVAAAARLVGLIGGTS